MKIVGVFALLFVVAVSSIHAEDDNAEVSGDKIPGSAVLAAVKSAIEQGAEFLAVDDVVAVINESNDDLEDNPLFRGIFKKCKSGECRKKCNAKGENGACVWITCVCWK